MIKSCAAIVIAAKHGVLTKVKDASGIAHTVGTLRCKFEFRTTDWDYTARTAVFCKGNVSTNPKVVDTAIGVKLDGIDECAVPPEVLLPDEKYFSVGVWGVTNDGLRIVSEWLVFRIKDGCYVNSAESFLPTPSVYEQIITDLNLKAPIDHKHEEYVLEETLLETMKGFVADTAQSDWNQTDATQMDYIKNKPDIDAKLSSMTTIDEEIISRAESDPNRPFSRTLYDLLVKRDRAYIEVSEELGGGVSPFYYFSANCDTLFNPFGYNSLEELCADWGWDITKVVKGIHYIEETTDRVTYHARLFSVVARNSDGNVRVGQTPKDSADATAKSYVDKYSFARFADQTEDSSDTSKHSNAYKVPMLGSKAKTLFLTGTSSNGDAGTFAIRTGLGALRGKVPETEANGKPADGTTLVNIDYVAKRFSSYNAQVKLNPEGADEIPRRSAEGEMRCNMPANPQNTTVVNYGFVKSYMADVFIDAESLPKRYEDASPNALYRVPRKAHEGTFVWYDEMTQDTTEFPASLYVVDILPEVGIPSIIAESTVDIHLYHCLSDNLTYLYAPDYGWSQRNFDIINNTDEIPEGSTSNYFVIENSKMAVGIYVLNGQAEDGSAIFVELTVPIDYNPTNYVQKAEFENFVAGANAIIDEFDHNITELDKSVGDISTALDNIIEIQNSLIGGES